MVDEASQSVERRRPRAIFRKNLLLPAEHGSWSWFLVPFAVGVLVAGVWTVATLLTLIGGLALFLMRQPATRWVRIRAGKGRRADESLAAGWTVAFAVIALVCLIGLIIVGATGLLWLILPLLILLSVYLALALSKPSNVRTLWMEVAGAAGLALMAPAAYIAGTGVAGLTALIIWLLLAGQNLLGVLYVRVRIADTHSRPAPRRTSLLVHLTVLATVTLIAFAGYLPWLAVLPFLGFALRSAWVASKPRPIPNIKRFGFLEIAVEIVGGLIFSVAL
jgi:hypothetical protein